MSTHAATKGWGTVTAEGSEIWDTEPIWKQPKVSWSRRQKLLFFPKKFFLYRRIAKRVQEQMQVGVLPVRILDVGCGTSATLIDLKHLFGSAVEVFGVDVVQLQIDIAKEKIRRYGVVAAVTWYDGERLPFANESFDVVYTSDVLGHVKNADRWLAELSRVLAPGGVLAMFAESALGRHAWIRTYLYDRGLNADPHADFHISLFSKSALRRKIETAGFSINAMYSVFWPAFFLHPEEFAPALGRDHRFPILRFISRSLHWLKQKTHPFSTAAAELYGLIEMYSIGRWIESQGYIVIGEKKK